MEGQNPTPNQQAAAVNGVNPWAGFTTPPTSSPSHVRVVVVDDDQAVLDGIATYLATADDIEIVGVGTTGFDAIRLVQEKMPDVLMTDVRMPEMDGITAAAQVRERFPQVRVVLLTTFDDDEAMLTGLQAGAAGFLLKNTAPEDLISGLRQVAAGGTVVSPGPTSRLVKNYLVAPSSDSDYVPLSPRELEVLQLLCQAYSNSEIAEKLFVKEATIKTHVASIMTKFGVNTRLKIVVRAHELGLVRP
ncbi:MULTISPECIES: response regulator transcription factor [unclassified Actinobaculum]|uniref:response regulator n=1 Tax=unclassified Actinobaculum TaxID=2609299 RepID=UPI000D52830A|nr:MULTISPECIES: response regulator transcription factor [unclassified Actinobaculum]AWE43233.1 DNA-binding response regulator [Actinobaculum sp. 313]RTE49867.1 response regulator transcription factor [Actinobaculum sp. 352]